MLKYKQAQEDTNIYPGKPFFTRGKNPTEFSLERISFPIQYNHEKALYTRENQQRRIPTICTYFHKRYPNNIATTNPS
jgi:hypothetical protein